MQEQDQERLSGAVSQQFVEPPLFDFTPLEMLLGSFAAVAACAVSALCAHGVFG